jgi:prevent-host-death family protein
MARDTYSTYEAKARFSELLKQVREGRVITVTWHGEPIAEIRPISPRSGTAARIEWLKSQGAISEPVNPKAPLRAIARRPGALARFLAERDEE